jgi:hypothetical protein
LTGILQDMHPLQAAGMLVARSDALGVHPVVLTS